MCELTEWTQYLHDITLVRFKRIWDFPSLIHLLRERICVISRNRGEIQNSSDDPRWKAKEVAATETGHTTGKMLWFTLLLGNERRWCWFWIACFESTLLCLPTDSCSRPTWTGKVSALSCAAASHRQRGTTAKLIFPNQGKTDFLSLSLPLQHHPHMFQEADHSRAIA